MNSSENLGLQTEKFYSYKKKNLVLEILNKKMERRRNIQDKTRKLFTKHLHILSSVIFMYGFWQTVEYILRYLHLCCKSEKGVLFGGGFQYSIEPVISSLAICILMSDLVWFYHSILLLPSDRHKRHNSCRLVVVENQGCDRSLCNANDWYSK